MEKLGAVCIEMYCTSAIVFRYFLEARRLTFAVYIHKKSSVQHHFPR